MNTDLPTPISTDGPPVDVPLLRKAVEWAEAEAAKPERESAWYQGLVQVAGYKIDRSCETAFCVAGYVAHLDGVEGDDDRARNGLMAYAKDRLGLTGDEAEALFYEDNSITGVRADAERIAARAGERL